MRSLRILRMLCVAVGVVVAFFNVNEQSMINDRQTSFPKFGVVSTHLLDNATCRDNSIVPNNWCLDNDQTPRYVGIVERPPRMIQHFTHNGYDKCLAEKTVLFIGDSRVRYQFMHLAAFLKFKRFAKCEDYTNINVSQAIPDPECFLINEGGKSWMSWYKQSTIMLDSNDEEYQQIGLCDCFRPAWHVPNQKQTYENRYIKRSTRFGDINLIYLQNFENLIRLDKEFPPFAPFLPTPKRCHPGECGKGNRTNAFEGDLNATMWNILPQLNTTHAFINLGWEHTAGFQQQSDFTCVMRDFERSNPGIKLFLISHPPPTDALDDPVHNFDATKLKCDANVLDRTSMNKKVPASWYWDKQHVLSILNEEYNHKMIEKICPLKG
mmetsp:Transcript_30329/g.47517  ORF Transcript_30329/g.47517 Transcript_30329/m.47517 type:complete len:380 (-) Transcript_30329:201-1340(-)|eukprot:CAMPEP_0201738938 /NCGR_PEP_ID=MMETSP0593-20130828/45511_1 /ASSEMBLY_ACC=CAM_ASM_000672 /TAXON_ID=267983 /ORGANISM="Skeletonema japonicum, Strain CCMP2506" /LENGTH=379 /DNA_ID=CAMNT_0048233169 /DNA_START=1660 /DNA_END=2799 /DNA_ORIENTATION=-